MGPETAAHATPWILKMRVRPRGGTQLPEPLVLLWFQTERLGAIVERAQRRVTRGLRGECTASTDRYYSIWRKRKDEINMILKYIKGLT